MENEVKTEIRPEIEQAEGNITVRRNTTIDFLAKLICLLLAFFLWYYASSIDAVIQEKEFFSVPVEIVNHGEFAVLSGEGMTVDVTLSGNAGVVSKIKTSDIRAYVDVSSVTEAGEKSFDITFKLPSGATLKQSSIGTVKVYLDKKASKTISVKAKLPTLSLSDGYSIQVSKIADIVITGPEQIVNGIVRAELPVNIQGSAISGVYSGKISLIGSDETEISESDRRYLRLSSDTAIVTVSLCKSATVPVEVVFKHGIQKLDSCTVTLSRQTIEVFGEVGILENLTAKCVIDEKTLKSGVSVSCVIALPDGVSNINDVSVSATVTLKNFSEKELSVPVYDQNNEYVANIKVKFRGESSAMSRLTASGIKASVKDDSGAVSFEFLGEFSGRVYEIYQDGSPYTVALPTEARKK